MSFPYIRYQLAHSFVAGDIHFDDDENYVNEHSRSSHGEDVMLRRVRAINIDTKGRVIDLPVARVIFHDEWNINHALFFL